MHSKAQRLILRGWDRGRHADDQNLIENLFAFSA